MSDVTTKDIGDVIDLRFTRLDNFQMKNKKIAIDHKTDDFLYRQWIKLDERLSSLTDEQIEILRCYGLLRTQHVLTSNAVFMDVLFSEKEISLLQKEISLNEREKKLEKKNLEQIKSSSKLSWRQRIIGVA